MYRNLRPYTLDQLKENIRKEIRNIPDETLPKGMTNMAMRMQAVIGQRGAYVDHVI